MAAILPGTQAPPSISLSIVSHGDWSSLSALLTKLSAHESTADIQLLVTDNLGRDLPELPSGNWHSSLLLRPARPRGFAANHNAAFLEATGTYFCVLNPDVLFEKGVIGGLIQDIERGLGDIVAPVMVDSLGEVQDSFRQLPTPHEIIRRRLGLGRRGPEVQSGTLIHPDWIAGTFMLMRSTVYSRLGGFDAGYRLYFEDVDLCTRARLENMSILVDPAFRILHDSRRRSRRPGLHLIWHTQSALRFFSSDVYRRARRLASHV